MKHGRQQNPEKKKKHYIETKHDYVFRLNLGKATLSL